MGHSDCGGRPRRSLPGWSDPAALPMVPMQAVLIVTGLLAPLRTTVTSHRHPFPVAAIDATGSPIQAEDARTRIRASSSRVAGPGRDSPDIP
eukprot:scaffold18036_cov101-Isochrysis_galbana.AAC.1